MNTSIKNIKSRGIQQHRVRAQQFLHRGCGGWWSGGWIMLYLALHTEYVGGVLQRIYGGRELGVT